MVKPNYIVIPSFVLCIMAIGRYFSDAGMAWYQSLALPSIIPPGWVYGIVWSMLYMLIAIVALWVFNQENKDRYWLALLSILCVNLIANGLWCYIFFYKRLIFLGFIDCLVVLITAFLLMIMISRKSRYVALLLVPYVVWMMLASYQNYLVWIMN